MKPGKKIIAALLSVATALTTLTLSAFADDASGSSTTEITVTYYAGSSSAKPAAPSVIKTSKKTDSTIKLSWSKVSGASSYDLRYKVSGSSKWKTVSKIKSNAYTLKKLNDSTKYVFQIRSRTSNGSVGKWSKTVSAKTSAKATATINPNTIPETPIKDFKIETNQDEEYYIVVKYTGSDETVKLPSSAYGLPVNAIALNAFSDNTSVKTIIIPESVDFISVNVFSGCTNLTNIVILGKNVTFLSGALDGCKATVTYNGKDYAPADYDKLVG